MSYSTPRMVASTAAIVLASFIPGTVRAQDYRAPRNATVNANGARIIRVSAGAGFLNINGRPGTSEVRITGEASSSNRRILDQIKLQAERHGDVVYIKAIFPDEDRSFWDVIHGDYERALDLTIDVPVNIPLEVEDGSGEIHIKGTAGVTLNDGSGDLEIRGITGNARVSDGSGNMTLSGIGGDVYVDDGSGNIDASNITGNFTIGEDGSGNIDVTGVSGTMRIEDDGSGTINVNRIGGDFVVDNKGSGSIDYETVKGSVNIPERRRRGRRGE